MVSEPQIKFIIDKNLISIVDIVCYSGGFLKFTTSTHHQPGMFCKVVIDASSSDGQSRRVHRLHVSWVQVPPCVPTA